MKVVARQSLFRFSGRQQVPVTQRYSPAQCVGTILHAILIPSLVKKLPEYYAR